jgi:hypothetical protein
MNLNLPWYMYLNLKMSICVVAAVHFIFLYFLYNGMPITLWNAVWIMQGLRPIPMP